MSQKRPEHLRAAIDRGKTRDKVAVTDPAAAPLGTDEEAAGTPVPPEAVVKAMRDETRRPDDPPRTDARPAPVPAAAIVLIAMALLVAFAVWWML